MPIVSPDTVDPNLASAVTAAAHVLAAYRHALQHAGLPDDLTDKLVLLAAETGLPVFGPPNTADTEDEARSYFGKGDKPHPRDLL